MLVKCWYVFSPTGRSSHGRCSVMKVVLKNFAKFTGKHLCQCHFFNKVIKKETLAQVFPCEFYEISKNAFFTEHLRTTTSRFCWASLTILEIFLKYSPRSDMM